MWGLDGPGSSISRRTTERGSSTRTRSLESGSDADFRLAPGRPHRLLLHGRGHLGWVVSSVSSRASLRTSMSSLFVKLLPSNYLTNKRVMLLERNRKWHITVS